MPNRFTPRPIVLTSNNWLVFISGGSRLQYLVSEEHKTHNKYSQTLDSLKNNENRYEDEENAVGESGQRFYPTVAETSKISNAA